VPQTAQLPSLHQRLADELQVRKVQIDATVSLLDKGATVPFIARYRKEATGGLDDGQLRRLDERLSYLRELEQRRTSIRQEVDSQGKLTPELANAIALADSKQRLEDLYLPYKVKRRPKADMAKEANLDTLADLILNDPTLDPEQRAASFLREPFTTTAGDNPGVPDSKAALAGAAAVLSARFSQDAQLLALLREMVWQQGMLVSQVLADAQTRGEKFRDYFDYAEPIAKIPAHRALALFRGRSEGVLQLALKMPEELQTSGWSASYSPCERRIAAHFNLTQDEVAAAAWLQQVVRLTWRAKLAYSIETQLFAKLRGAAEADAISVFANNLKDLLLAAPAGAQTTMGLDPGIRTGVKVAVVDGTGKLLATDTVYPFQPKNEVARALQVLAELVTQHQVSLVAIGNGTASRETQALVNQLQQRLLTQEKAPQLQSIMVSEAGASVYSASELAALEFPGLDVSLRGAVSIARRLQDPLAELVKIEPKAIGVGQYQHDLSQSKLSKALDSVVEDCVNSVGVDLNSASAPLLARIAGLSTSLAANVVALRDAEGAFSCREDLRKVPRLGPKAFEQAAGFLRITDGTNPLDASAVHPEAYPVAERILADLGMPLADVRKQPGRLRAVPAKLYINEQFGLPTAKDILLELEKPGRDPRPEFKTADFKAGVHELKDLEQDMVLEGVVTNVTNFGAFVDVGVHQDGLVHISALADTYVKDPRDVVKTGDIVRVKVMQVDIARKRIGLSMRLHDSAADVHDPTNNSSNNSSKKSSNKSNNNSNNTAMAKAFANARKD